MTYNSIRVVKGNGGYGGPLVITPTEEKHKFILLVSCSALSFSRKMARSEAAKPAAE